MMTNTNKHATGTLRKDDKDDVDQDDGYEDGDEDDETMMRTKLEQ